MTAGRSDLESASLDAYIADQLARASAELARHTDTEARLHAVLQAPAAAGIAGQEQKPDADGR